MRCRDSNVISGCVRIHPPVKSPASNRILRWASLALVRERINHTRRQLDDVAQKLYQLHLLLASFLAPRDWEHIDVSTTAQAEIASRDVTERHHQNYDKLNSKKLESIQTEIDRTIVNLTNEDLDDATKSILAKGLNFAVTPKSIPYSEFIGGVE
ncbi:hypothetical protein J437_LFUL017715 [Ladona fulva]|uniref:Uncharacterized protein n=1 Tax=Ladona fulva TaxID=123851 RepID=A0A8K0P6P3_LADFU|nr:hypothetical protein J437_LFUL017715 [Ladona fulva]